MITLSSSAITRLKEMQTPEQQGYGLRVSVSGGGCSGLSYKVGFEKEAASHDRVVEQDGLRIFIDPKSDLYLNGMMLDFVRDQLQGRFVFNNPNAKTACGCGTSFSTA